jgi:uncharacterized protein
MATRDFDPLRLDVPAFAKAAASLSDDWPIGRFERLAEMVVPGDSHGAVAWSAVGERRESRGSEAQTWLHLKAATCVPLTCQRCLEPVTVDLDVARSLRFVAGEDQAAELDAESEDDVLALTRALNLGELIEDELLLALPLVPTHTVCPQPLPGRQVDPSGEAAPEVHENPFAALAVLKAEGSKIN